MHKGEKTVENKNEKKDKIVNNENTTTEKKKTLKVKTAETEQVEKKPISKRLLVPGIIVVILIVFAVVVYWAKVMKPKSDVDKDLGIKTEDYISVGDVKGLTYELTQDMWDESVYEDTDEYEVVNRAAKETDQVEYNRVAYVDNKKVDDLSGEEQDINILSSNEGLTKTFSDKLTGHKSGETVTVEVKNNKEVNDFSLANKDYSSKTVVFKLKITSVNKLTRNKITDKWVKDNYYEERGISTVKEYNEWILEYIKEEIIKPELWQKALKKVNLKAIPSKLQQEVIDSMNGEAEAQAEYESLSLDEYKKREGLDDKTMQENYKTELKSELLMWQLVKDLKLTASNDEIEEQYENSYADANLDSVEEMKKLYTKEEIKEVVLLDKAQNYVFKNAKIKYSYKVRK